MDPGIEPILEAKGLSKDFSGFTAVKEASFSIAPGEIFGFLGPNGAGKTTTINMLTGLARPTAGSFSIAGVDGLRDIKGVQRLIGIVPDDSNLYDDLNGFDNLTFCGALYGLDKDCREQRAAALLEQFGLAGAGTKPFRAYSKGMKRKLTIAAGIIHQPQILFLDEPTTGIDVESARQIRQLILALNQKGATIFLTTHYIEEAERLCHRIGFIVEGRIIRLATTEALLQAAKQQHTLEFSFAEAPGPIGALLTEKFPGYSVREIDQLTIRVTASESIALMPLMNFFDSRGGLVQEAKRVRPSLEEVFVEITGIEARAMKEQGKRVGKR